MLSFSKIRFLSLLSAIERVLQMYKPLKQYFETIESPTILKFFFKNPLGDILLWFVYNNFSLFHQTILNVEGTKICATETELQYFKLTQN